MGFCIAGSDGRIHAANRRIYTLFDDYPGGFCRWWSKTAERIVKQSNVQVGRPAIFSHSWTGRDGIQVPVTVWLFNARNRGDTVFLFIGPYDPCQGSIPRQSERGASDDLEPRRLLAEGASNGCMMKALADGGFAVRYQPIYDIRKGRVAGFEAQILCSREGSESLSSDFFDLLDTSGGALLLGIWFISRVCDDCRRWQQDVRKSEHYFVQLHLSRGQMDSLCILHALQHCLDANDLDPSTVWIKAPKASFETRDAAGQLLIHRYHALGVNFIVDRLRTNLADLRYFFAFSVIPFKAVHLGHQALGTGKSSRQFELFATFAKIFSSLGIHVLTLYSGSSRITEALRTTTCRYIQKQGGYHSLQASQVPAFLGAAPAFSLDPARAIES